MNRVIIMGSPRSNGRCAHLAEMLFEACIDECPEDELFLVPVSELEIEPCVGCGACRIFSSGAKAAETLPEPQSVAEDSDDAESADYPYCPRFDDDMQDVYPLLPAADELIVVAPVFFSGAPASLKALLDRLQPHFWAQTRKAPKRSAALHVVGEGGDPYGYGPLVSEASSSLACAGFRLERVLDWVGKIDVNGEITGEAAEIALTNENKLVSIADVSNIVSTATAATPAAAAADERKGESRPKLDLSADKAGKKRGRADVAGKQHGRNPGKGSEAKGGSKGSRPNGRTGKKGQGHSGHARGSAEAGRREKRTGHSQERNRSGKPGNSKGRR